MQNPSFRNQKAMKRSSRSKLKHPAFLMRSIVCESMVHCKDCFRSGDSSIFMTEASFMDETNGLMTAPRASSASTRLTGASSRSPAVCARTLICWSNAAPTRAAVVTSLWAATSSSKVTPQRELSRVNASPVLIRSSFGIVARTACALVCLFRFPGLAGGRKFKGSVDHLAQIRLCDRAKVRMSRKFSVSGRPRRGCKIRER